MLTINEQTLINEQCKFLQKYFLEYQKFVKQQQELLDRKKRWKKIIEQCKTKRRLLLQQKELGEEENRYKDSKETITTLFDEKWFEAYQKYNADKMKIPVCIYGFLCAVVIYGGIMDTASVLMYSNDVNTGLFTAAYISGFPVNVIHGISTIIFMALMQKGMIKKLNRVKIKYSI